MIREYKKPRVVCFGAAGGGERLFPAISEKYEIIAFTDNDERKWGKTLCGIPILTIEDTIALDYDLVVITSAPGRDSIIEQLSMLGVGSNMISTYFIDGPIEARKIFLKKLSELMGHIPSEVQVAEAGVFEGDFARYINEFFPDRICHLFDTFEGFAESDIQAENGKSEAAVGDYSNTSVDLVMKKMPFKDMVVVHKGFFPETAYDVTGHFCFVNLDLDLYEPTYQGLNFFEDRMVKGGIILVHDFFATNFRGPKEAVLRFMSEKQGKYDLLPIGDGISVMICGFGR